MTEAMDTSQTSLPEGVDFTGSPTLLPIPTLVLGATGYVAAEIFRWLALHPGHELVGASTRSAVGQRLEQIFPHLSATTVGSFVATAPELDLELVTRAPKTAVFCCLPHTESGARIAALYKAAQEAGTELALVDLSADHRLADPALFERVYGQAHPDPDGLARFTCALPDLARETPRGPVAHPGCFTTAVSLALAPLAGAGLVAGPVRVSAITGSTGSGRSPGLGTHHPLRNNDVRAYGMLAHRHHYEMQALADAERGAEDAARTQVHFVPTSGPFTRGIHATVFVPLAKALAAEELTALLQARYADTPFVSVSTDAPRLKSVVGTNRAAIGVASSGDEAVLVSVIDNLAKGAAGGAVQWMNRLLGRPLDLGLRLPGIGF